MSAEKYLPMQSSESLALGLIKGNTNGGLVPTFLYLKSEESKVEKDNFSAKFSLQTSSKILGGVPEPR